MFKPVDFSETSPVPPDIDLAPTQSPHHVAPSQDSSYDLLSRSSDDKIDAEKLRMMNYLSTYHFFRKDL